MEFRNHFNSATTTARRLEAKDNHTNGTYLATQGNDISYLPMNSTRKLQNMKTRNVPGSTWLSFLVVFVGTAELYCGYRFIVPMYFTQYGEWAPFYMKVFITFVYVQVIANWFCVKRFHPFYIPEEESEISSESPWEEFEKKPKVDPRYSSLKLRLDGAELPDEATRRLSRETATLSWKHCNTCQMASPPRSHHCKICNHCVLKRDHHCFLTGTCIGHTNQRYFVVLNFYLIIAMGGGLIYLYKYMSDTFYEKSSIVDYFLPVIALKCLFGDYEHQYFFMICFSYTFWWVTLLSAGFLGWQIWTILAGKTPFELKKNLCIKNTESLSERIRSVFGAYWLINFLLPAVKFFPQSGDGTSWEKLKIIYKYRVQADNNNHEHYVIKMANNRVSCDVEQQPDIDII